MTIRDLTTKVANNGANVNGKLTAEEYNVLITQVKNMSNGAVYMGIATPTTAPQTYDGNVDLVYIASQSGKYANFGNIVVNDGEICALHWQHSTGWSKEVIPTLLSTKVDKVEGKGLSTNDYTTNDKTRVGNSVTGIRVNGRPMARKDSTGLLDIGDVSNLYVADFTIEDLENLSGTKTFLNINARALIQALKDKKAIGVLHEEATGADYGSMLIASAYIDGGCIMLTVTSNLIMYRVTIGTNRNPEVADSESGTIYCDSIQVIPIENPSFAPFFMDSLDSALEGYQVGVPKEPIMAILEANKPLFILGNPSGVTPASYSITKKDGNPTAVDIDIVYNNGSYHIHWDITDDTTLYLSNDTLSYTSFSYISTTYNELKRLRHNNQLTPSTFYRITDYITTTSQENTSSAGHPFDVIVLALSDSTLSEQAYAVHSDRDVDGYFANSNLAAWKIWYCLDNDTTRFAWAGATKKTIHFNFMYAGQYGTFRIDDSLVKEEGDTTYYGYKYIGGNISGPQIFDKNTILWYPEKFPELSTERTSHIFYEFIDGVKREREIPSSFFESDVEQGKGVIYRMIDEWGNDCPYDFKNIVFTRYELIAPDEYEVVDDKDWCGQLTKNIRAMFDTGVASYKWSGIVLGDKYWEDDGNSIYSQSTAERKNFYTFSDITNYEANDTTVDASLSSNCYSNKMGVNKEGNVMKLPNNVFFGKFCHNNKLGEDCYFNSFGDICSNNSFGNTCYFNSFGDICSNNSFGNECYINNFGDACEYNSFGCKCGCNSLGSSCSQNKFDTSTGYNSFGYSCYKNKFGYDCCENSFGESCESNSLGNSCYYNNFTEDCIFNSLGNSCVSNRLGRNYKYNTFGEEVHFVHLANNEQGGYDDLVQNYRISNGIQGTYEERITLNVERNRNYETTIARNSDGEIVQFCVADLI